MKKEKENKVKKPFYKKWWFWVIIVVIIIGILGSGGSDEDSTNDNKNTIESQTSDSNEKNSEQQETNDIEESTKDVVETTSNDKDDEETTNETQTEETTTPQDIIENAIRQRISDEYTFTDIDSIRINENLGTDDVDDDYIALVDLTWTQMNKGPTSKKMLSMYSEDLAAYIGEECPNVQEIAIFWTVPYLDNANAKCAYERKGEGMYEMDMMWDNAFN